MDRIESDESSYAVPAVPTAAVKTVSFDKARLQSLADIAMSLVHCASSLFANEFDEVSRHVRSKPIIRWHIGVLHMKHVFIPLRSPVWLQWRQKGIVAT